MDSVLLRLTARNIKTLYMQFLVVTAAIPFCLPPSHLAKLGEGWGSDWHAVCLPVYPAASNTVMSNEIKSNLLKHKDRMAPYNARSTDNNEQYIRRTWKGGSRRVRDSVRLPRTGLFATTRRQLCYIFGNN